MNTLEKLWFIELTKAQEMENLAKERYERAQEITKRVIEKGKYLKELAV